jgi:DNA-binding transcriptional ArsR family regulator
LGEARDPADAVFGALSDPTRRALLASIAEHPAITATELASHLPISRQAVVKHLGTLTDAGLLERAAAGREVRYRVTPAPLSDAVSWMAEVGGQWDERLAALARTFGPAARAPRARRGEPVARGASGRTRERQRGEMPK